MTLFFLFSVIAVLLLANLLIFRKKSLKVKIIGSIALLLGAFILFIAVVAILFYNSTDPRERAAEEGARNKWLSVKNLTQSSHQAIVSYLLNEGNTTKKISDTLNVPKGQYNSSQLMLPMLVGDSTYFPEGFKIQIKDSLNNLVAEYDKAQFLQKATTDDSTYKPKNKMTISFYVIEINGQEKLKTHQSPKL